MRCWSCRPGRSCARAGPQLGGELTTVRFDQSQQFQTRWRPGLAAGVMAELRLRHWALQPALRYAQRGYRLAFTIPGDVATATLYHRDQTRLHYRGHQRPLLPGIGPEQVQLRGVGLGFDQHRGGSDGVLHAGRLHVHGHEQAAGVDGNMALTASYLLARVVAVAAPLLPPVRTDCESMAPAVGSASRLS